MIDLRGLTIILPNGEEKLADGLKLSVEEGQMIGIYGPSGVGKSLLGLSLIGLSPERAKVKMDASYHMGTDKIEIDDFRGVSWSTVRRDSVGYIFQQPASYLNPVLRCGRQILEGIPRGKFESKNEARLEVFKMLKAMDLEDPERVFKSYPHQLSVGQLQRVMATMALIKKPRLVIADEPFASVDSNTRRVLMDYFERVNEEDNTAFVVISHRIETLTSLCNDIYEYDRGVLNRVADPGIYELERTKGLKEGGEILLRLKEVSKSYSSAGRFQLFRRDIAVLDAVNLELRVGEVIGILGRSGSGKSTLARIIAGLEEPSGGRIELRDVPMQPLRKNGFKARMRHPVQMIFQDPFDAFDAKYTIMEHLNEAVKHSQTTDANIMEKLMRRLNLTEDLLGRKPTALSGGQLQRFCIMMNLILLPDILICDESFSALDYKSKTLGLQVILEMASENRMSVILISHEKNLLRAACQRIFTIGKGDLKFAGYFDETWHMIDADGTTGDLNQFI